MSYIRHYFPDTYGSEMLQETANGELVTSIAINVELGGAKDVTPTRWLDFLPLPKDTTIPIELIAHKYSIRYRRATITRLTGVGAHRQYGHPIFLFLNEMDSSSFSFHRYVVNFKTV